MDGCGVADAPARHRSSESQDRTAIQRDQPGPRRRPPHASGGLLTTLVLTHPSRRTFAERFTGPGHGRDVVAVGSQRRSVVSVPARRRRAPSTSTGRWALARPTGARASLRSQPGADGPSRARAPRAICHDDVVVDVDGPGDRSRSPPRSSRSVARARDGSTLPRRTWRGRRRRRRPGADTTVTRGRSCARVVQSVRAARRRGAPASPGRIDLLSRWSGTRSRVRSRRIV